MIVSLYDLRGMTMKQIALQLRVDESRISQLHSAALRRLQERVRGWVEHPLEGGVSRLASLAAA